MFTSADYRKARQNIRKQQLRLLWAAMREVDIMPALALIIAVGMLLTGVFALLELNAGWTPLLATGIPACGIWLVCVLGERHILLRNPDYLWAVYHISLTPRSERTT